MAKRRTLKPVEDMLPRPVEQDARYNIRCGHIERGRPSQEPGEFHWRCPAWFTYDPFLEDDWEKLHCPLHRPQYREGPPAIPQEVKAAVATLGRYVERVAMPQPREPWIFPGAADEEKIEDDPAAAQRKAEQLARAHDAGLEV